MCTGGSVAILFDLNVKKIGRIKGKDLAVEGRFLIEKQN